MPLFSRTYCAFYAIYMVFLTYQLTPIEVEPRRPVSACFYPKNYDFLSPFHYFHQEGLTYIVVVLNEHVVFI